MVNQVTFKTNENVSRLLSQQLLNQIVQPVWLALILSLETFKAKLMRLHGGVILNLIHWSGLLLFILWLLEGTLAIKGERPFPR